MDPVRSSTPGRTTREPEGAAAPAALLVVDDDEVNVRTLARLLRRQGYDASGVTSGLQALELAAPGRFDLVILDVVMPEMSGLEVLRTLRGRYSLAELPVIMATGLGSDDDVVEALEAGANDYLTKPIDPRVASARINTQLELKRSRDEVHALNLKLKQTQAQVGRLMSSSSSALADVAAWARSVSRDVAETVGVAEIGVWAVEQDRQTLLVESSLPSPLLVDLACIYKGGRHERGGDTVLPAIGFSGQMTAALVVPGTAGEWSEAALPILEAFAHQLGAALELRWAKEGRGSPPPPGDGATLSRELDAVQLCPRCAACYGPSQLTCPRCGPDRFLRSLWTVPHRVAGRYRLTSVLGSGGMASVFAAQDERLDREVAVKVLRAECRGDEVIRARFEKEARAVARIADPGIVAVYDCGEIEGGSVYIAMDRLHGHELAALVEARGAGTPAEVARLVRQAASTIDAAHRANIVHRDIKPSNLFLVAGEGGFQTKVLDFGVAKRCDVEDTLTGAGIVIGTPLYMSPEQAGGEPVGFASDLYSLAAVAFFALTGRRLSEERKWGKILADVIRRPPPLVSASLPGIPEVVDRAFLAGLAKRPADRPDSARAWADSFAAALEAVPSAVPGWRLDDLRGSSIRSP